MMLSSVQMLMEFSGGPSKYMPDKEVCSNENSFPVYRVKVERTFPSFSSMGYFSNFVASHNQTETINAHELKKKRMK